MVPHTRGLLGGEQVAGDRSEELARRLRRDRLHRCDVDHDVASVERAGEPAAGDEVDPGRSGEHERVVSALPDDVDDVTSDDAGSAGDGHPPSVRLLFPTGGRGSLGHIPRTRPTRRNDQRNAQHEGQGERDRLRDRVERCEIVQVRHVVREVRHGEHEPGEADRDPGIRSRPNAAKTPAATRAR